MLYTYYTHIQMTISTTKMRTGDTSDIIRDMTERESHEKRRAESPIFDTEGLPTGEQKLEDVWHINDELTPAELEAIRRVADEIQLTQEERSGSTPVDLVIPDEAEPPFPSVNTNERNRV